VKDFEDSKLTEQQYADMKQGLSALWALVVKNRSCLERLLGFNREINVYLSLKTWDSWIDFPALVAKFEPALAEANLFLQALDAVIARNDILQVDLMVFGQQLALEMKSSTVKPLAAKFYKLAQTTQKQVDEAQSSRFWAQIEAQNTQFQRQSANSAGYILHGDGTVTDTKTGLMWMQCAEGQGYVGSAGDIGGQVLHYTWDLAMRLPTTLNQHSGFAGHHDWRLPSLSELQSLVRSDERPTICAAAFPQAPIAMFWSSTLVQEDGREAWNVYFGTGSQGANDRDNAYSVRLVRTA
jgi:Protein of unknown function (DUF1566)